MLGAFARASAEKKARKSARKKSKKRATADSKSDMVVHTREAVATEGICTDGHMMAMSLKKSDTNTSKPGDTLNALSPIRSKKPNQAAAHFGTHLDTLGDDEDFRELSPKSRARERSLSGKVSHVNPFTNTKSSSHLGLTKSQDLSPFLKSHENKFGSILTGADRWHKSDV